MHHRFFSPRFEKSAALLIAHPHLSIAEIASMTGFSSQRYFSTSFKGWKGISPSEYREKMQSE
ncbi:helix-turn-helix domain-containing protein [Proteiniphilum sp. X52]|uniref:helix-turn-helix domain-containing protein n=1 Tax=Proteiniphilum sp. X52 TaxID=2382159 RepID=UPI00351A50EB